MKITEVEAIELRLPEPEIEYKATAAQDALILKIHTDAGIVGIGEVDSSPRMAKAVVEAPMSNTVATGLGRLLIGMNPLDIEVINEKLYRESFYCGRRAVVIHTIGGIDIALWDIAGKFYRQPVYQLLGGAFQKRMRAYASDLFGADGEKTNEKAKRWIDRGFTAVKFGWAPMGRSEKMDLELVEGARRGIGDENDLFIDAGCCWDTKTAKMRAKQFEAYSISWLEEPLQQDNIEIVRFLGDADHERLLQTLPGRPACCAGRNCARRVLGAERKRSSGPVFRYSHGVELRAEPER